MTWRQQADEWAGGAAEKQQSWRDFQRVLETSTEHRATGHRAPASVSSLGAAVVSSLANQENDHHPGYQQGPCTTRSVSWAGWKEGRC